MNPRVSPDLQRRIAITYTSGIRVSSSVSVRCDSLALHPTVTQSISPFALVVEKMTVFDAFSSERYSFVLIVS
jgi:hypothetical protein